MVGQPLGFALLQPPKISAQLPDLERRWQQEIIHIALVDLRDAMGEQNYQILQLHFRENRTAAEIADLLGLTPEQVSARQYRLLKQLRDRLHAYCGGDLFSVF